MSFAKNISQWAGRITLALAAATLLAFVPANASAQGTPPNTPPGVDHYLVYKVLNPPTFTAPIILGDQFIPALNYETFTLEYFMNPVNKNNEGIIDPVTHYTWWRINSHPFGANVLVGNQFVTDAPLAVGQPEFLLNPALKNDPTGGPVPVKNHFKVYDATSAPIFRLVNLLDQFGQSQAYVDTTKFLAVPAQKIFNGQSFPILDPIGHLVIYRIESSVALPGPIGITAHDEFGFWQLQLGPPVYLAVPSFKSGVVPTKTDSWGHVKSLYHQ